MPLKLSRYPRNWRAVAHSLKEAAGWRCQECDLLCRRPGETYVKGSVFAPTGADLIEGWRHTLTVAHVEPESQAPDAEMVCVMMLCASCHARFDAEKQSERQRRYRRRFQMALGPLWSQHVRGTLALDELEELAAQWPDMPEFIDAGFPLGHACVAL